LVIRNWKLERAMVEGVMELEMRKVGAQTFLRRTDSVDPAMPNAQRPMPKIRYVQHKITEKII
jgi:hypothetical protein